MLFIEGVIGSIGRPSGQFFGSGCNAAATGGACMLDWRLGPGATVVGGASEVSRRAGGEREVKAVVESISPKASLRNEMWRCNDCGGSAIARFK
jgi:hypothetical protein